MAFADFPQDAIFPLIVFGHQVSLSAIETEFEYRKMIGIINHASRSYQEMVIVLNLILHEGAVLEMGIERFFLF